MRSSFSSSAPKRRFILYNSFSLRLTENLCLQHFSLKCIIKNFYLSRYDPHKRLNTSDTQSVKKSALNNSVNKVPCRYVHREHKQFLSNYEINGALLNINKSTERQQQERKFTLKQQAPSIHHQREHLSIQLLEIIQTILFIMI